MGIKERRQRQRQQLRESILSAAREIASSEGWQAVTIRKIAARVEYSPPVIYEYFDSKEDLLLELVREGYAGQLRTIEKARNSSDDPEEALLAMARAWCRFASESPDLYQVMYGLGGGLVPRDRVGEGRREDSRDHGRSAGGDARQQRKGDTKRLDKGNARVGNAPRPRGPGHGRPALRRQRRGGEACGSGHPRPRKRVARRIEWGDPFFIHNLTKLN